MKNIIGMALMLTTLFLFSGCATKWDADLNAGYNEAEKNGQNKSAEIVTSKTEAIAKLGECPECTKTESILLKVVMSRDIAMIEAPQFHVKAPTLNTDNVKHVADTVQQGIPVLSMVKVSTTSMENQRGNELHTIEGDINVEDSLNNTVTHTTSLDGSTSTSSLSAVGGTDIPEETLEPTAGE